VTDEEIIDMATRANILEPIDLLPTNQWRQDTIRELHTFARLIAAKQREIDAALCLSAPVKTARQDMRDACANAIRSQK
jgi:hypothetical protein